MDFKRSFMFYLISHIGKTKAAYYKAIPYLF